MEDGTAHYWRDLYLQLRTEVVLLKTEIQQLKDKLGTNSSNSSTPPSQDPFRKKRDSKPSGKKAGGQPGHPGHARNIHPAEQLSKTVEVNPASCPRCHGNQFSQPVSVEVRQVVELPEMPPEVTQYNIHTCKCRHCGENVRAQVPKEAERGFGPRLMAFVTMLTADGHVTKRKICTLMSHLRIKISLGALCNVHKLAGVILEKPSREIQCHVMEQKSVNADESGWRLCNKRCWIWIGTTPTATVFKIDPSRSQAAFERLFGSFSAILTTDRHGAYNQHKGDKQTCLAHIRRDFEKIKERTGIDGSCGRILKDQLDHIFVFWSQFKKEEISREILQQRTEEYVENIRLALIFATQKAKSSKTIACAHNLLDRYPTLWTFLRQEGVEPTNNLAERGLRPAVIFRKLSGGSQSEWGARMIERLMTVSCTLRQNARNLYVFLKDAFDAHLTGQPPPLPI